MKLKQENFGGQYQSLKIKKGNEVSINLLQISKEKHN
jgi:hypothetical protein